MRSFFLATASAGDINFIENAIFCSKLTEIVLEKANKRPALCRKVPLYQRIVLEVSVGLKLCAILGGGHLEDGGAEGHGRLAPDASWGDGVVDVGAGDNEEEAGART
jgi:hypothetical protein